MFVSTSGPVNETPVLPGERQAHMKGKITIELITETPDSGSGLPDLGHTAYWLKKVTGPQIRLHRE